MSSSIVRARSPSTRPAPNRTGTGRVAGSSFTGGSRMTMKKTAQPDADLPASLVRENGPCHSGPVSPRSSRRRAGDQRRSRRPAGRAKSGRVIGPFHRCRAARNRVLLGSLHRLIVPPKIENGAVSGRPVTQALRQGRRFFIKLPKTRTHATANRVIYGLKRVCSVVRFGLRSRSASLFFSIKQGGSPCGGIKT